MCFHLKKTKTINTYSLHNNVIVIIARHNYASLFRIVSNKSSKSCGNSACLSIYSPVTGCSNPISPACRA